jgi:hypothetical protein
MTFTDGANVDITFTPNVLGKVFSMVMVPLVVFQLVMVL